jgi:SAM-dependent methyltransferase
MADGHPPRTQASWATSREEPGGEPFMSDIIRTFVDDPSGEEREEIGCPVCSARKAELVFVGRDRLFWRAGVYPLVRCRDCAMLYVNPRPTVAALGAHYPSNYFAYALPNEVPPVFRPLLHWFTRGISLRRIRYLEAVTGKLGANARVVDVGCGINSLLYWLRRVRGCEGIGVDMNPAMSAWVKEHLGMRVEQGTLEQVHFEDGKLDVVFMTEYLEHEPDPRAVLREARRILAPGGHLAIEIPDPTGWPARLFRSLWWNLDVPRHLVFFGPDSLARLLDECGFELVRTRRFGLPFYIGTSLYQAIGLRYSPRLHWAFTLLSGFLGVPFFPFAQLAPEFLYTVARAR